MTEKQRHAVIAAAGTGGHVMPGIAVAKALLARGWRVTWMGTTTGMEGGLVAKHGIPFRALNFQGVRGKGLAGALRGCVRLVSAFFASRKILREENPDVIFSTGGYVAVPVGFAGRTLGRIPMVLMNCDVDLLMSTNTLLPFCRSLACGFAGGARSFAGAKGVVTGNPVRSEIEALPAPSERLAGREGPLRLFVFGGSLGAQVLNDVLPEAIALIPEEKRPVVLHQTGRNRDAPVREHYAKLGVAAEVVPFIDDMAARYREADLVLCRAGATSVSELAASGSAAVLVPFIAKTTSHQLGNARFMAERGGAVLVEQRDFTSEKAADILQGLSREKILAMAEAARAQSVPHAAERVADLMENALEAR